MSSRAESSSETVLDASVAEFLQQGISVVVAARDRNNVPTVARGTGCRVSADRRRVSIFISATQGEHVLKCIRDNGEIAVVFSMPSTHRTVQVKGKDAVVGGLEDGDLQRISDYRDGFARDVSLIGFDELLIQTLLFYPSADIVSLNFTPSEAYSQTPGPRAGEPLRSGT
ncbi:MAG TPA: hypothetical protein VF450_05485 [Noviherbaspirillum sp.]|jgi:hypothetical protein